ncbi:MAG: GNAT family N-acetyltransferase [Acidimicrobiales bacterium]
MLQRSNLAHLDGLQAALAASHDELRAFMDWVGDEPQTIEVTRQYLIDQGTAWEARHEFTFAMTDPANDDVIGNCSLMARQGPGRLEIGYWVRSDRVGAGVATAAASLLTDAAFDIDGIEIVEIHHDAANVASSRVPEKLGYTEVARRPVEIDSPGEVGIDVVWELTRSARP